MYKGKIKSALEFTNQDDSSEYNDAYSNLNKSTLVQESNIFNDKNLIVPKCVDLLNKFTFLLNQGEEFPDSEKSKIFFNVTKLFQVNTPSTQSLRRLMYVFIKELKANENEVFIVISQLTKDVGQNENEMYKANALRVLTKIIDDLYVQSLEKYLKQALIDKSNHVVSAALVSLVNLYKKGGHSMDIVKKSINEVQDKLMNSGDGNLQYQALLILFELKKNDQMAVLKLLFQLTQTKVHNSITKCQLIRYIKQSFLINPMLDQKTVNTFLKYIESCLAKEEDAVQFEAAKTMCDLYEIFGSSIVSIEVAFQVLMQLAVNNTSKPVNKYAALRVLNRVASKQPQLIFLFQSDLETLITDMNRSVASLAISTLLKTCNEDSVQKLLKQISHYLPDLGLDFKIETIQSTALLYHRLPQKADVLLKFLTDCLKEEGNVQFRESVVDTIMEICPSQREIALMILAEHIEDCEHAHIQTKIINFLAEEGPKSKNPASYIRFIYNRVNLEKAVIRAAAISALAAFAHKVHSLRKSIMILLQKCLTDSDDEVRERAFFYLNLLRQKSDSSFLTSDFDETEEEAPQGALEKDEIRQFIFDSQNAIDIDALQAYVLQQQKQLVESEELLQIDLQNLMCVKQGGASQSRATAMRKQMEQEQDEINQVVQSHQQLGQIPSGGRVQEDEAKDFFFQQMSEHPDLAAVIHSSKHLYSSSQSPVNDSSAEYVVHTVKHFFDNVIIVQYSITNTLEDQILSNIKLNVTAVDSTYNLKVFKLAHCHEEIKYSQRNFVYVVLTKQNCEHPFPLAKLHQKLSLKITEIDVDSQDELGSYDEDYALEEVSIAVRDYIKPHTFAFKEAWETIGSDPSISEVVQTFQIPFKQMDQAVQGVIKFFGMGVCDGTDKVNVTEKVHNLLMGGLFMSKEIVAVRAQIGFNQEYGCVLKVTIRSLNNQISNTLLEAIN